MALKLKANKNNANAETLLVSSDHRCCAERRYHLSRRRCLYTLEYRQGCCKHATAVSFSISQNLCGRLLNDWVVQAKKHDVWLHNIVCWVRHKIGSHISVWRWRSDGSLGCAMPCTVTLSHTFHITVSYWDGSVCTLCSCAILKFHLKVHCSQANSNWFTGRLTDHHAPTLQCADIRPEKALCKVQQASCCRLLNLRLCMDGQIYKCAVIDGHSLYN